MTSQTGCGEQDEQGRQQKVEVLFDAQRPRVRERASARHLVEEVLRERQEFPQRRQRIGLAEQRYAEVQRQHHEIDGNDAEEALDVEIADGDRSPRRLHRHELAADEIAAQDEEEVDAAPSEPPERHHPGGVRHEIRVVEQEDVRDGERPEVVEAIEAGVTHESRFRSSTARLRKNQRVSITSRPSAFIDATLASNSLRPTRKGGSE